MAVSSGVAIAGIGIAIYFFLRRRSAADALASRFAGLHRLLLNKYSWTKSTTRRSCSRFALPQDGLWRRSWTSA